MLPPDRAPFLKTPTGSAGPASSSSTPTHVHQATFAPVVQHGDPALRDGPVVTPRLPAPSAGRYPRKFTEESRLSSSRSTSEPPAPREQSTQFLANFHQRAKRTRGGKPWVRIRIMLPRPGAPARGHHRPKEPRTGVPRRGYCRPKRPRRQATGWHRRV